MFALNYYCSLAAESLYLPPITIAVVSDGWTILENTRVSTFLIDQILVINQANEYIIEILKVSLDHKAQIPPLLGYVPA